MNYNTKLKQSGGNKPAAPFQSSWNSSNLLRVISLDYLALLWAAAQPFLSDAAAKEKEQVLRSYAAAFKNIKFEVLLLQLCLCELARFQTSWLNYTVI